MNTEVHIIVKRKYLIAAGTAYICMMVMTVLSVGWANYVDQRSNQRWCGIVKTFNETYEKEPPPSDIGRILQVEFLKLRKDFKCK